MCMSETSRNLGDIARSFLPETYLIRNRDVEALFEKYHAKDEPGLTRTFDVVKFLGAGLNERVWSARNPLTHDFSFGSLGFEFERRPPVQITKSTAYDKNVAYSKVLSIHFGGNIASMRNLPEDLANATTYLTESGLAEAWPYVFAVTHGSLAKIAARRGMREHTITGAPDWLKRDIGLYALADSKVKGSLTYDPSCHALSMPMDEFIQLGQSSKALIR